MVLDTDILVDIKRGHPPATAWFATLPEFPMAAGFAAMELIYGSWDKKELRAVRKFLRSFPIAWPTEADLLRAIQDDFVFVHLAAGMGLGDAVIASTVVGLGLPLATFNVKHYRHVPGLTTVQPYNR